MNEFENLLSKYSSEFPKTWSFLWSPEEAEQIPNEHKDQIHFLNEEGTKLLDTYLDSTKITRGLPYSPFKDYFKKIDTFTVTEQCDSEIKKWLYKRGIPFSHYVFISSDRSGYSVMLTWKMVIKYWEGIFFSEDLIIFDTSLNWGLFYYHESQLYYGEQNIFDSISEGEITMQLNQLMQKFKQ